MDKVVIFLDGKTEDKNNFVKFIKYSGYWTWNVEKWEDKKRDVVQEIKSFGNKYLDLEYKSMKHTLRSFLDHDSAKVLIFHNVSSRNVLSFTEMFDNTFSILLTDNDLVNEKYDKTLNCSSKDYEKDVLFVMNVLTHEF